MFNRYMPQYNSFKHWFRGMGFPDFGSKTINPALELRHADGRRKKYIWRDSQEEKYKIEEGYEDIPLQLSNYLLLRTRERLFVKNQMEEKLYSGTRW